MEDDEDFGEEDGYEDEDDLLKGMDFLNDIDNAETMEIPVREVKKFKPAEKSKKTDFRRRRNGTADRFYAA